MLKAEDLKSNVVAYANKFCEELKIELVEANVALHQGTYRVQVFVDRSMGGIEIDECIALNKKLDTVLFEDLDLGNNYTLEVSSPGIDRLLRGFKDFRRVLGRDVRFFLTEAFEGKKEIQGAVKGVREKDVLVDINGEEKILPLNIVDCGKQII